MAAAGARILRDGGLDGDPGSRDFKATPQAKILHGLAADAPVDNAQAFAAVHPEDRDMVAARLNVAWTANTDYGAEYRAVMPDGSMRWLATRGRVHRTRGPARLLGVVQDITARRQAEDALRLTTERFQLALKASPIVLFSQDADLRYTWIYNPALDYEPAHIIGKLNSQLFERPEDAAVTEAIKREVFCSATCSPRGSRHSRQGH